MSDFMYELEDNVWDEFGPSSTDDHIVPHPVDECGAQFKVQGDGRTKPRQEGDNTIKYGIFEEKGKGFPILTKNRMLEKDPWSDRPDGIFPTSGDNDSLKEVTGMVSDDPMMSSHGLKTGDIDSVSSCFCADDLVLVDNCATEDNYIYSFPLNRISEANDDVRFFNNKHGDKESGDLLCYGWGDIGNFEDVDRMFRNCDSTFGLGSHSNEDDLCWVSSSQATDKLNTLPENCATSNPDAGTSTIDSNKKSVLLVNKISSLGMSSTNPGLAHTSSSNVSNNKSGSKDGLTPNELISPQSNQSKQLSASGERIDHLKNGDSYHQYGNMNQFADVKRLSCDASYQLFSSQDLPQQKQNIGPDSVSYVQTNVPSMHLNYSSPSTQISRCPTLASNKSKKGGHPSLTSGSSYASSQAHSIDHGHSFEVPDIITNEKRGKLYLQQDTQSPLNGLVDQAIVERQVTFYDPVTAQKQTGQSEWDEGHSEGEGFSVGRQAERGSSNGQENSCVSSMLAEVSVEATSFQQLQQVMEKLDNRTKLCIRDSLYRLARSAEQRHNCANTTSGSRDDKYASGPLEAEETSKCNRFMDIETDTNPIDRSIAHLLFHRPSDPSLRPGTETTSLKSHGTIRGSTTTAPVIAEKHVGHDRTGADSDEKPAELTTDVDNQAVNEDEADDEDDDDDDDDDDDPNKYIVSATPPSRKLLIFDLNGVFAYIPRLPADVVLITGLFEFMQFCVDNFVVAFWSSKMRHNVDRVLEKLPLFSEYFLFVWDQAKCKTYDTVTYCNDLNDVWNACLDFNELNTLLVDDSAEKMIYNPKYNYICPHTFDAASHSNDNALEKGRNIREYLENLLKASNASDSVKNNHFSSD